MLTRPELGTGSGGPVPSPDVSDVPPPVPDGAAVAVEELTVRYGDRVAVDRLSLEARRGEVMALLGRNGAGKTSTIETLEGYRRPTSGTVRVLGLDPVRDHRRLVPHLGVMLQDGGVATAIRPPEVLHLYAAYYPDPRDPDELLDRLGLTGVRATPWRRLSGGERQRLSLALAVIGRPSIVFLDEPTAGVDVQGRGVIREVVAELRAEGACVLLATHELDEAERMADRVAIVDDGRMLACGTLAELTRDDAEQVRFTARSGLDVAALGAELGAGITSVGSGDGQDRYTIAAAGTPALVATLAAWLARHDQPLDDLQTGGTDLEELFLRLTGTEAS
jgi:ABC-2 type transport system ATP-binding protein